MAQFELESEIKELDVAQIYFRAIDRIQNLSFKDYKDERSKLFDFSWSVNMFMASIPEEKRDSKFNEELEAWQKKNVSGYKEKFDYHNELFYMCINLLSRNGILYRKSKHGTY